MLSLLLVLVVSAVLVVAVAVVELVTNVVVMVLQQVQLARGAGDASHRGVDAVQTIHRDRLSALDHHGRVTCARGRARRRPADLAQGRQRAARLDLSDGGGWRLRCTVASCRMCH